jgi:hypothetical protein
MFNVYRINDACHTLNLISVVCALFIRIALKCLLIEDEIGLSNTSCL